MSFICKEVPTENGGYLEAEKELIQCKDCQYYEPDLYANPWGVCCHREWIVGNTGHTVDNDGYCYRAERKEKP